MIYKCISFTADVVPATAKQHAGETYFRGVFINNEDEYDMKSIKVNFFPTEAAHAARFQELVDGGKLPGNANFGSFNVKLPAFKMKNNDGTWRDKIYDNMDVHVRLTKNSEYVPGKTPEFIPEIDPKRRAEQTISRLGAFMNVSVAVVTEASAEDEVVAPAIAPTLAAPIA